MKKLLLTALLFSFFVFGTGVFAQESGDVLNEDTELETSTVFTKERETQRIKDLRLLYRDQVEVYRNSERDFSIAKTNFEQVQTLSALEEAVKSTQTVMTDRSKVMITYLELIDAVLVETNGVELDLKNQSKTELIGLINLLKIHQENILLSKDRQAMVLLSDDFVPISEAYESSVYKALSLIRIGQIQEVRDKSEIIEADIIMQHEEEEVGGVQSAKRDRAYAEIERGFELINADLADLNESFLQSNRDGFKRSFYQRILTDLSPIYAQISRSLDHLEELITL